MKKMISPVLCFLVCSACNSNSNTLTKANAYIFERKARNDGKLLVSYAFNYGKTIIQDSSVVSNEVLPLDSVTVVFEKNNPADNTLLLQPGK